MGKLNFKNISPLTEKRILRFLNSAYRPTDILLALSGRVQEEGDYGIGPVVAKRIIEAKREQPSRRFQKLSDLNGIKGFGQDKFNDIAEMFSPSTAAKFLSSLTDGLLYDNFPVRFHAIQFPDEAAFLDVMGDVDKLRVKIQENITQLAVRGTDPADLAIAENQIAKGYLDFYDSANVGSYAFSLWFYQFDQDNWFAFDSMQIETEEYLAEVYNTQNPHVFALIKGFDHRLIGQNGIVTKDLPIVFSQEEHSIYLWTAQLFD